MTGTGIEPFGFFTWDALRAGWYMSWRIFVRVLLAGIVLGIAMPLLPLLGLIGGVVGVLGALVVIGWVFTLVPRIASQWSEQRYGRPLDRWLHVWWGITWRAIVVGLVCSVILGVPAGLGASLVVAYKASVLGFLGGAVSVLVVVANSIAGVLGQGWAISRVVVKELGGQAPMTPKWTPSQSEAITRVVADPPSAVVDTGGKRQCPKCGLYETERGSVIGWYCKVCGWREARR
jgi:hypothetical protein